MSTHADRPQPIWRFEPRELRDIAERPFDGYVVAEYTYGDHDLRVIYDRGRWWFEDLHDAASVQETTWPETCDPCTSLTRALRRFWRRTRSLYGHW